MDEHKNTVLATRTLEACVNELLKNPETSQRLLSYLTQFNSNTRSIQHTSYRTRSEAYTVSRCTHALLRSADAENRRNRLGGRARRGS